MKCKCGHSKANHRSDYGCMGQHKVLLTECSCKVYFEAPIIECLHSSLIDISSVKSSLAVLKCNLCRVIVRTESK